MKIVFILFLIFFSLNCYSEYRVGLFQDIILDLNNITHIIVVGSAVKEDSDQFFQSGLSRAYRYKELHPNEQVVIMSSPDVLNTTDEDVFFKYNVLVEKVIYEKFTAKFLLYELNFFNKIASIDFYGHSSPWGLKIGDHDAALVVDENRDELLILKDKFISNAYMTLNACNTGFKIAPALSAILNIPVSGTLTSSLFENISSDGSWYKEDDYKIDYNIAINKYSYNQTLLCSLGLCYRMKSARVNYSSVWGFFKEGGLSFSKFFCNFDNDDFRCERGMANSMYSFPSVIPLNINSTFDEFKTVVYDWLCSTGKSQKFFKKCVIGINNAISRLDLVFQSHPTNELMCDFKSCYAHIICQTDPTSGPKLGTCHLKTPSNPEPTNIAREFLSFKVGFTQLIRDNFN